MGEGSDGDILLCEKTGLLLKVGLGSDKLLVQVGEGCQLLLPLLVELLDLLVECLGGI